MWSNECWAGEDNHFPQSFSSLLLLIHPRMVLIFQLLGIYTDSCSACSLPTSPGPYQSCSPVRQPQCPSLGNLPFWVQGLAFPEVSLGQVLQLIQVPMNCYPILTHILCSPQFILSANLMREQSILYNINKAVNIVGPSIFLYSRRNKENHMLPRSGKWKARVKGKNNYQLVKI